MLPHTHPPVAYGKTGLLLVNLGTPDSPDKKGYALSQTIFERSARHRDITADLATHLARHYLEYATKKISRGLCKNLAPREQ